jgi:hypothetical protein
LAKYSSTEENPTPEKQNTSEKNPTAPKKIPTRGFILNNLE